jgi:hypothetical protein
MNEWTHDGQTDQRGQTDAALKTIFAKLTT